MTLVTKVKVKLSYFAVFNVSADTCDVLVHAIGLSIDGPHLSFIYWLKVKVHGVAFCYV